MPEPKPRRRRVWDDPPETRKAWKKNKKADLRKTGHVTRHAAEKEAARNAKKKARRAARAEGGES